MSSGTETGTRLVLTAIRCSGSRVNELRTGFPPPARAGEQWIRRAGNLSGLFHCSIFSSCSEKTAPEEQAGAARSIDRRKTRRITLLCQCTIRLGVLNRDCPWMRPVLQSGHGVAAARQGIGRAARIGPSDGSQVVAGWKKERSEFLILAMPPILLPDQQGDRRPHVHLSTKPLSTGLWAPLLRVLGP